MIKRHRDMNATERFWLCVQKAAGCWLWTGYKDRDGYGRFKVNSKTVGAHQFSYQLHRGAIPNGLHICHHCDNPSCVNSDHLFLGTNQDNIADRTRKGRTASGEHNGHYTKPENTKRGTTHYNYGNTNAPQKGVGNGRAKLTEDDVRNIRRLANRNLSKRAIAAQFGVTDVLIGKIIRRELWPHVQ